MKVKNSILFLCQLVVLTACGSVPVKDFHTIQWLPAEGNCHYMIDEDDELVEKCYDSEGTNEEQDWIVIKKSDLYKELNYQDLLINRCKVWKE